MIITAKNLTKKYGQVLALDNFSLEVSEGRCFALLGKNGAGKTTFVKSLLGLVKSNSGELSLCGEKAGSKESRREISYLPEKFSFYPYYTLEGVCEFYGKMKGLAGDELKSEVQKSLDRLGIGNLAKKKVKECSKGQLQRTGIAATLVGSPKLLILDEPYSGLDPVGVKELQDLIIELKNSGITIFLNSHGLDSIQKVCDDFAIVDEGKLLVQGNLKELVGEGSLLDYFYDKVGKA